jgi:hypothetical protein
VEHEAFDPAGVRRRVVADEEAAPGIAEQRHLLQVEMLADCFEVFDVLGDVEAFGVAEEVGATAAALVVVDDAAVPRERLKVCAD